MCAHVSGIFAGEAIALHLQIDQEIEAASNGLSRQASPPASDAEFLRRVCLDLTGRIPIAKVVTTFLGDADPEKRIALVDRLLASPQHVRHLQHVLDSLLMQRRPEKHVKLDQWQQYLFRAVRENKSWDQLTREVLSSDGATAAKRPAARFLLDRQLKIDETTRDIGRVFLGRDLQCAQCHDHPEIDDYAQRHYYGITAFLQRSYLFTDPSSKQVSIGEKADGLVKFTSVFTSEESQTQPRILDLPEVKDPPPTEEPYESKPQKATRGIPKYSRRLQLGSALTSSENRSFRDNIANRVWALLMGRGLVEPLDMFHEANPPSHPGLLDALANDLLKHGYDLRRLIREIVLSQPYQRSSLIELNEQEPSAQQYQIAQLKPLTPEQLAWSTMQAVGLVDVTQAKMCQKLTQDHPALDAATPEYAFQLEQEVDAELRKHVTVFVEAFASESEQSGFDATASQALFLMNDPLLTEWLEPTDGNLLDRLLRLPNDSIAREVYLSALTRAPTDTESQAVARFLDLFGDDRQPGIQELVRTILCSAEFRLNH